MSGWGRVLGACWLMFACIACDAVSTPTQLLVIVDSSIDYGTLLDKDLSKLEVRLLSGDGSRNLADPLIISLRALNDASGAELPLSFALTPEAPDQHSIFRLVISGMNHRGVMLVQQQVFTAFRQGEARVLDVVLPLSCREVTCHGDPLPGDLTCTQGRCGEIPTRFDLEPLEGDGLSEYESPFASLHQGRWGDGGPPVSPPKDPPEGGIDGGSDAPADDDGICGVNWIRPTHLSDMLVNSDMLLVFDRSGAEALRSVVAAAQDLRSIVNLGLYAYPSDLMCGAGKLEAPIGAKNGQLIVDRLVALPPQGFRPTGSALQEAVEIFSQRTVTDAEKPAFVLLVTSGEPSCDSAGGVDEAQAAAARKAIQALRDMHVLTYVVGEASEPRSPQLDKLAELGGTGMYRSISGEAQWMSMTLQIVSDMRDCVHKLERRPPNQQSVVVAIHGMPLPASESDGWSLSGDTIVLHGLACRMAHERGRSAVSAVGCF